MTDEKRRAGRPRERADAVKMAPISIRTIPELRAEILRRSKQNQLSFTQQVERLLRIGMDHEDKAA